MKDNQPTQNIALIAFSDLMAMYDFLLREKEFAGANAKQNVHERLIAVEKELYERTYGFNPHEQDQASIKGEDPQNIDLSKFDTKEGE